MRQPSRRNAAYSGVSNTDERIVELHAPEKNGVAAPASTKGKKPAFSLGAQCTFLITQVRQMSGDVATRPSSSALNGRGGKGSHDAPGRSC